MKSTAAKTIYRFFLNLEKDRYIIYDDGDKDKIIKIIKELESEQLLHSHERVQIIAWLEAIGKGDLGDWCASYYYNLNNHRILALRKILTQNLQENERLDFYDAFFG